ncbi:hypothetical protein [Flavobacterium sp.]|uniref:hypothetical protein n=1 Tax=Flavobacterium sp. TaxID=239 RepID=UPI00374D3141
MKDLKSISLVITMFISFVAFGQEKDSIKAEKTTYKGFHCARSITKNEYPLCVVDDKIVDRKLLEHLDTNVIESVSVLKGPQAVALYGIEGSNGVLFIKTKNLILKDSKGLITLYSDEFKLNENQKKKQITGIISDCEGIALANVTISNLNTKEIVKSDSIGKYNITVHKNDVLEFSLYGFESQRVLIEKQKEIDLKLRVIQNQQTIMLKKPVIYLYPMQKTDIIFTLDFKGKLLTTFPKYETNWDITAYPDGKIFDKNTNRFYTSLFWDGENNFTNEHYNYKDGFVVSKNNLTSFLIEKLEFMGLNTFETNEFVQYWLPILEKNDTNFIHFWVNEDYTIFSKNNVNPKPNTSIRIFMEFYGLENPLKIPEQILLKTRREGFTLVEWGGSDVSNSIKQMNGL